MAHPQLKPVTTPSDDRAAAPAADASAAGPGEHGGAELAALLARATGGDVAAFERLIGRYQPQVYRYALAFAGSRDEANDLAQEALIKVYRSIGSFRFQSAFSTWLWVIVRNTCFDQRRSRGAKERSRELPIEDEALELSAEALAEDRLVRQGDAEVLWRAVRKVTEKYREVMVMFDVDGLSYDEIARAVGCPVGTVKSRINRGREELREHLFRERHKAERGRS